MGAQVRVADGRQWEVLRGNSSSLVSLDIGLTSETGIDIQINSNQLDDLFSLTTLKIVSGQGISNIRLDYELSPSLKNVSISHTFCPIYIEAPFLEHLYLQNTILPLEIVTESTLLESVVFIDVPNIPSTLHLPWCDSLEIQGETPANLTLICPRLRKLRLINCLHLSVLHYSTGEQLECSICGDDRAPNELAPCSKCSGAVYCKAYCKQQFSKEHQGVCVDSCEVIIDNCDVEIPRHPRIRLPKK